METNSSPSAKRWPDFLIIGAAKAGTTALFKAVARHPCVYEPAQKEPRFFSYANNPPKFRGPNGKSHSRRVISSQAAYNELFLGCPQGSLTFEASTEYLSCERAPAAAAHHIPNAKLIAILRHPIERAFSQFLHFKFEGCEPFETFEKAWEAGSGRLAAGWRPSYDLRGRCRYGTHLTRWLAHFPAERLLILFYEDWLNRPQEVLSKVWRHLGLDPIDHSVITKENVTSRQPRWAWLHHRMADWDNPIRLLAQRTLPLAVSDAITRMTTAINTKVGPTLNPALSARLALDYEDDLAVLEKITGRNLAGWRT
jgi:hypothetical protein